MLPTGLYGQDPGSHLRRQLTETIQVQRQPVQFIAQDEPFLYLNVELAMDLNWKPQHTRMTNILKHKLDGLGSSYASPGQLLTY